MNNADSVSIMNLTEKQNLYNEALAFYELAECGRIHISEKANVESFIPYIVNMAFCAELYLKLLLIENGKSIDEAKRYSHNLYKLYMDLTDDQKEYIYQAFKRPLIYSIEKELQEINNAFPDWRYLVLNKANQNSKHMQFHPFFIKEFNEVLRDLCKNILNM